MPLCEDSTSNEKKTICDVPKSKTKVSKPTSLKNSYSEEMASLSIGQASLPDDIVSLKIETSDSEDIVSLPQGLASLPKDQASLYRNDLNSKTLRSRQQNNRIINIAETSRGFRIKNNTNENNNNNNAIVASMP